MDYFRLIRRPLAPCFHTLLWIFGSIAFAQSSAPLPSSLRWYAEIAKQRGQTSLEVGHVTQQMQQRTPEEIARQNDLVLGKVESSSETNDDFQIFTWYRIKLVGSATTRTHLAVSKDPRDRGVEASLPASYRDLKAGEILVRSRGGSATVDGVSITQNISVPMVVGRKYLLFLRPLQAGSVYEYGAETEPLPVRDDDTLAPSSRSKFAHQFGKYPDVHTLFSQVR